MVSLQHQLTGVQWLQNLFEVTDLERFGDAAVRLLLMANVSSLLGTTAKRDTS
jgi:hypothetical protein